MPLTRNKLYAFMGLGNVAGVSWLVFNYNTYGQNNGITVCFIKNVTGIPCPSCGSTRAVEALIHGNLLESITLNPIGLLLTTLLAVLPIWILIDLARNQNSLFNFYQRAEPVLRQKKIAIPAIALLMANWIWNIYKGL
ncbi:MAG: DUF2752 domain-containing protein [Cyclobacteriaceae bacterium]|nr:DUF2752 domain-containing protein [Cyclobacteriaceae bacterium]